MNEHIAFITSHSKILKEYFPTEAEPDFVPIEPELFFR